MALPNWQATIVTSAGDIIPGATIEVINEVGGTPATIFSDRTGTTGLSNPFFADSSGFAEFYAAPGEYRITATSVAGSRTWRWESLPGTASRRDVTTSATDTTDGRVWRNHGVGGMYGLGSFGVDFNAGAAGLMTRIGRLGTDTLDGESWHGIHFSRVVNAQSAQFAIRDGTVNRAAFRVRTSGGVWRDWDELHHTGNYPSDTAWTSETDLLNDWTGTVPYIKRAGMVTIAVNSVNGSESTSDLVLTLPLGYRPAVAVRGSFVDTTPSPNTTVRVLVSSNGQFTVSSTSASIRGSVTYPVIT